MVLLKGVTNVVYSLGGLPLLIAFVLLGGIVLLHALVKIYGGTGPFRATAMVWLLSHVWMMTVLLNVPTPIKFLVTIFTGKILVDQIQKKHFLDKGVALSVVILYGVFVYILFVAALQTSIFYAFMLFIIYLNRQKLSREAFVLLYRTRLGISLMEKIALACPRVITFFGLSGIFFGFVGMILISLYVFYNAFQLIFVAQAVPGISPLLPGVELPGSPITLPLFYGILSLFFVVVIHEFSHGVLARVYRIPVKSSGLVLFGPLLGAFVEPDEGQLRKQPAKVQLSVFSAGPFSNLVSAFLLLLLLFLVISPITNTVFASSLQIQAIRENSPAAKAGIPVDAIIFSIAGKPVSSVDDFVAIMKNATLSQVILLQTNKGEFSVLSEQEMDRLVLGVTLQVKREPREAFTPLGSFPWVLIYLEQFLSWLVVISIGIGVANLLPLGPVDGGRMLHVALEKIFNKKEGEWVWRWVGTSLFLAILFILLFPLLKASLPHLFP